MEYENQELIFKASHMHKAFGPTIALKDVDFELHRGEIRARCFIRDSPGRLKICSKGRTAVLQ